MVISQNLTSYDPTVNNVPTSPEAALFTRFGDIPVGYYTGTVGVSVPIYTIKVDGVEIPIELKYHSSGNKVSDEATWVGLGWDLSPGGAIIQEVRGRRDDFEIQNLNGSLGEYNTFMNRFYQSGGLGSYKAVKQKGNAFYEDGCNTFWVNGPVSCIPAVYLNPSDADPAGIVGNLLLQGGDPDIYHYNFAGHSGKFYINPQTQQVVLIDQKEEDILFEKNSNNFIVVTLQDGTKFHFNIVEVTYENGVYVYGEKSGKTFKLSYVQFKSGKSISFNYVDSHTSRMSIGEVNAIVRTCDVSVPPNYDFDIPLTLSYQADTKTLSKIITPEAIIDFNLGEREDINIFPNDNLKRLNRIDITSVATQKKIKTFEFGYSYFPYNFIGYTPTAVNTIVNSHMDAFGKRLKLDFVKECGYTDEEVMETSKPAYKFEYDMTHTMPLKISFAKDFWGYYNGENNTRFLPDLDYFDYPHMFINFTDNQPFNYNYTKANRYTNNNFVGAYLLKKIIYPTGGSTEFQYEPNSFINQFIPDKTKINISKKRTILENRGQGNPQVNYYKNFTISKTTTISFNNSIYDGYTPIPNPNAPIYTYDDFSRSKIVFSKIKILNGQTQTTIIKQWESDNVLHVEFEENHGKTWTENIRVEFDPDPSVYYKIDVINTLNYLNNDTYHIAGLKADFHFYDDNGINTTESNACGMRIKNIKNFDEKGILTNSKRIKYSDGKLLNRFKPIKYRQVTCFRCTQTTPPCPDISEYGDAYEISISTETENLIGNLVGYGKVEEFELNNKNEDKGKTSFLFINEENLSSNGFYPIENIRNGLKTLESVYSNTGVLLLETYYTYSLSGPLNYFYSIRIVNNYLGPADPLFENPSGSPDSRSKFTYYATPINSERILLTGTLEKKYFNGNAIIETETHTYNDKGKIKTVTKSNSNNEQFITKYYYASDYPPVMINESLVNNNMTGIVLKKEEYNGTELLSTYSTEYGFFDTLLLPKYIYASKGAFSLEKKVTFDLYDNKGNILQYTLGEGIPISLQWDITKNYILTKAENVTYDQINTASSPGAIITRYTHKPLVGVTSIRKPNGDIVYYDYDSYGLLIKVKDKDGNLLNENEYNYLLQNQ